MEVLLHHCQKDQTAHFCLIVCLTDLLTTAKFEDKSKQTFVLKEENQMAYINEFVKMLMDKCKQNDLYLTAHCLDCFYEVFSEDVYDTILIEHKVIEGM